MSPFVWGIAGPAPTSEERAVLAGARPAGVMLFARNIVDPVQLRGLTNELRVAAGCDDLTILVDQEGGRVARLRPPHWPASPPAAAFGALYARAPMTAIEAARAHGMAQGAMLRAMGIDWNAAPILDLAHHGDGAIGDRAFARDPLAVAALGRAMVEGLAATGVTAIVKHLPGHGRATADPHHGRAVVEASAEALEEDLAPFRTVSRVARAAMVGHPIYPCWDAERPASLSPVVIATIRDATGFDGLLISDDLAMGALAGSPDDLAAQAVAAGCDLALCCHATPAEAAAIADRLGPIAPGAAARMAAARLDLGGFCDAAEAIARRDALFDAGVSRIGW
ncbi:beta-N-acetylhexosaminidase [Sphingomonas metalli]|uniref:beta-N-acetylhexosaminidase n=1 Tax=Sphingomonas metalli TaxID=1779358 RepID=A0A916SUD0_9SPHN|nr:beta-N-acetylhexosaminidase [Sphingomonas metalli]GGB18084.1 beta-N-acetylhexosaminidase [Sphingomonas metalli]